MVTKYVREIEQDGIATKVEVVDETIEPSEQTA